MTVKLEQISLSHGYKDIDYKINFEIKTIQQLEMNVENLLFLFRKNNQKDIEEKNYLNSSIECLKEEIAETQFQLGKLNLIVNRLEFKKKIY